MIHWGIVIIAVALFALHERLSASKHWFFGGLLPLAGAGALVYELCVRKSAWTTESMIGYLVFFAVTLLVWGIGRYEYRRKELAKMQAKDIR